MAATRPASASAPILVVDDQEELRAFLSTALADAGHEVATAASVDEAIAFLEDRAFHLVLCDIQMPGRSGLELGAWLHEQRPATAFVMVTGIDDPEVAAGAIALGASGYLVKPFAINQLLITIDNALHRRRLELASRTHREDLERTVDERTASLRSAVDALEHSAGELRRAQEETVFRLARAAEFRDPDTGRHLARMSGLTAKVAASLGLPPEERELLRVASVLHDVGKIAIPDTILLKSGPLTDAERTVMQTHPQIGFDILSGSDSPNLQMAAEVALTHHERTDGTGYPAGLAGDEIPVATRIVTVCDVFDALISDRVYRDALPFEEAFEVMRAGRGAHFDPAVLDAFLEHIRKSSGYTTPTRRAAVSG